MAVRIAVCLCLVFAALPLSAGEQPSIHLTGNPSVDFFGAPQLVAPSPATSGVRAGGSELFQPYLGTSASKDKSPWTAGFLSLVVPGLGEVYSESYLKGAIFFAADVAAWALAYTYNKKGDRQTDEFQAFANLHWSAVRYANWTMDNLVVLTNGHADRSQYEDLVLTSDYDPDAPCGPPFRCIDWGELNAMEDTISHYASEIDGGNGYTHRLPYFAEQQYYELIGKYDEFSRGWDDANLGPITPANLPLRSNSARFYEYANMRAQANHYYDIAGTWVGVAVLNHLLSAVDAYWSATRYNSALQAEASMHLQPTPYGMVPVSEVTLRYSF